MCLGVVHSGPEKRIGLTKMSPKTVPHILKIEHDTKSKTVFNYIKFWKSFDVNTVQTICQYIFNLVRAKLKFFLRDFVDFVGI